MTNYICIKFYITSSLQDVKTLNDDVKSLTQLVIVIQEIAHNETDDIIQNFYQEIIYSTNRSIVALNNLVSSIFIILLRSFKLFTVQIAALENNDDEYDVEGKEEGKDEDETDNCNQLDKAAKLSALKVQVILTSEDIEAV